jgi:hypothetical protein
MMQERIEKCRICGQAFYAEPPHKVVYNYDPTCCPQCNEKARKKKKQGVWQS